MNLKLNAVLRASWSFTSLGISIFFHIQILVTFLSLLVQAVVLKLQPEVLSV